MKVSRSSLDKDTEVELLSEAAEMQGLSDNIRNELWHKKTSRLSVSATFPTEKLYYPLKLTSVYGAGVVPAAIRVAGFVTPEVSKNIAPYIKTRYFIAEEHLNAARFTPNEYTIFTKIDLAAPGAALTDDLWIDMKTPTMTRMNLFIFTHSTLFPWMLFISLMFISGFSARFIVPSHAKGSSKIMESLALGVAGCFSLVAVVITALFIYKEDTIAGLQLKDDLSRHGHPGMRQLGLILGFASPMAFFSGAALLPLFVMLDAASESAGALLGSILLVAIIIAGLALIKHRRYRPVIAMLWGAIISTTLIAYIALISNALGFTESPRMPLFDVKPVLLCFCILFAFLYYIVTKARNERTENKIRYTALSLGVGILATITLATGTIVAFRCPAFWLNTTSAFLAVIIYSVVSLVLGVYLPMGLLTYQNPKDTELFQQFELEKYSSITFFKRTHWLKAAATFTVTFMLLAFLAFKVFGL